MGAVPIGSDGKAMSRPKWQAKLINRFFGKIFLLAKISRLPILGTWIYRLLFDKDDITFIPINESLEHQEHVALPSDIIRHFIMRSPYIWIKDKCVCRTAENCKNYPRDLGCIYLGTAVKNFHPDLGRMATVDEALEHVRRCEEAGLVHMIGINKLDSLMLNCAPSDALMTICNCCECCCFFRILPGLNEPIREKIRGLDSVVIEVHDGCTGCGACTASCFAGALSVVEGRAVINENCIKCGKCVRACGAGFIKMTIDDPVFIESSITRIMESSAR
jgi:ferredoxin